MNTNFSKKLLNLFIVVSFFIVSPTYADIVYSFVTSTPVSTPSLTTYTVDGVSIDAYAVNTGPGGLINVVTFSGGMALPTSKGGSGQIILDLTHLLNVTGLQQIQLTFGLFTPQYITSSSTLVTNNTLPGNPLLGSTFTPGQLAGNFLYIAEEFNNSVELQTLTAVVVSVPEPETYLLLGSMLLPAAIFYHRKKKLTAHA